MTILAGVFSRKPLPHIPDSICNALRRNISRNPKDLPIEFRYPRAFFVKVDIGVFGRLRPALTAPVASSPWY